MRVRYISHLLKIMLGKTLVIVILIVEICYGQKDNCESKQTCHECIQKLGCVWCTYPKETPLIKEPVRCMPENDSTTHCNSNTEPSKRMPILEKDEPLSSAKGNVIQLKPQKISVHLRKDEVYHFNFQYKQAENYPVDLYYIMDLSASMDKHRLKLGKLGSSLFNTMRNLTNNFRLGFGSFVDKVSLPFVNTVKKKLEVPCTVENEFRQRVNCKPPYSYKNHLSLTEDHNRFTREVSSSQVSGNLDSPEGGLDALMQAMVCKKEIGWRPNARHLVVFSTDDSYHTAGDGKLAGVIEPNDAKCHMTNDSYTHSLKFDYPSVSQINYIAKKNNINIVFAIAPQRQAVRNSYEILSKNVENSNMGILDSNSGNVVNLVEENYRNIVNSVTMTSDAPSDVDVKFSSNCPIPKENGCSKVHVGDIINFTATIRALECSPTGNNKKIITIKPAALEESIIIELNVICNCDCESPTSSSFVRNDQKCSYKGNLECGICNCNSGRYGKSCECDGVSANSQNDNQNCRAEPNGKVCSGYGSCKCGKCVCQERPNQNEIRYGEFCQCTNFNCNRGNNKLCSGNGKCDCGTCKCNAGFTGDACECPDSNSTCIEKGHTEVCSGRGSCFCGKCSCYESKEKYSGDFCQDCLFCKSQRCDELVDCVECQAYNSGKYNITECKSICTKFKTSIVNVLDEKNPDFEKCKIRRENGCNIKFIYSVDENKPFEVFALKEKDCRSPNILAWILGVIGSILIIGILTLILWKIFTTVHDRREYAKFENERKQLKWHRNDNPIFKEATTTFKNPAYNK